MRRMTGVSRPIASVKVLRETGQMSRRATLPALILLACIPLVLRYPRRVRAGGRESRLVICQDIAPTLIELAGGKLRGRARFVRLDVDESVGVPGRLGILSIPTVVLFAGGEERARVVGAQPRSRYEEAFAAWL